TIALLNTLALINGLKLLNAVLLTKAAIINTAVLMNTLAFITGKNLFLAKILTGAIAARFAVKTIGALEGFFDPDPFDTALTGFIAPELIFVRRAIERGTAAALATVTPGESVVKAALLPETEYLMLGAEMFAVHKVLQVIGAFEGFCDPDPTDTAITGYLFPERSIVRRTVERTFAAVLAVITPGELSALAYAFPETEYANFAYRMTAAALAVITPHETMAEAYLFPASEYVRFAYRMTAACAALIDPFHSAAWGYCHPTTEYAMIAAVAFEAVSIVFSEVADVTVDIYDGAGNPASDVGNVFHDEFRVLIPVFAAAIGGVALLVIAPQTMLYDDLFA
ncbi:MAG: hypothetical protein ACI4IA_00290, partial [Acutalibacteraceae bacterium]